MIKKREVIKIDATTGEELARYSSVFEAAGHITTAAPGVDQVSRSGNICGACKGYPRRTAYGFRWKYADAE